MTWFPQIGAGSVAQFPLARNRQWRTIANELESGARVALADTYSNQIGWSLSYQDLSDAEVATFTSLFAASKGQAASFGFVDPLANVLAWSGDLTRADWQAGLLQVTPGVADPLGGTGASRVANTSAGPLTVHQTTGFPGSYMGCFSVWLRSATRATATLVRDSATKQVVVTSAWTRVSIAATGVSDSDSSTCGVTLAVGQQFEVFGPQFEAQPYLSAYKPTTVARGIYQDTRFAGDEMTIVGTGPGLSACQIGLISRIQE